MATTLPTSITHGSESRISDSSIHPGVDELNNDNNSRYRRRYNDNKYGSVLRTSGVERILHILQQHLEELVDSDSVFTTTEEIHSV